MGPKISAQGDAFQKLTEFAAPILSGAGAIPAGMLNLLK